MRRSGSKRYKILPLCNGFPQRLGSHGGTLRANKLHPRGPQKSDLHHKNWEYSVIDVLGSSIRGGLMKTGSFPSLANTFLQMEQIIANVSGTTEPRGISGGNQELSSVVERTIRENVNTTAVNSSQVSVVGWDPDDPFTGVFNIFTFPAVTCLDVSYANIDTAQSFTNYIYNQIQQNALVGELGGSFASCLGWPNLTAYNPETIYADNYPSKLANQMLVIGVTDDPVCPYPGALETYALIGDENAVFLVHEGWDIALLLILIIAHTTSSLLSLSMVCNLGGAG
jgi:hypothetical protein